MNIIISLLVGGGYPQDMGFVCWTVIMLSHIFRNGKWSNMAMSGCYMDESQKSTTKTSQSMEAAQRCHVDYKQNKQNLNSLNNDISHTCIYKYIYIYKYIHIFIYIYIYIYRTPIVEKTKIGGFFYPCFKSKRSLNKKFPGDSMSPAGCSPLPCTGGINGSIVSCRCCSLVEGETWHSRYSCDMVLD